MWNKGLVGGRKGGRTKKEKEDDIEKGKCSTLWAEGQQRVHFYKLAPVLFPRCPYPFVPFSLLLLFSFFLLFLFFLLAQTNCFLTDSNETLESAFLIIFYAETMKREIQPLLLFSL
jgi:hypothetical protein